MKLKECFVENFGKLHHYKMEFNDGLNILLKENGFGKTTLAAFIEALFYGLDSGRGKESDRKKYDPWQGGRFGGSVVFSVGDKNYRLERFFGKKEKDDTFNLYNNDTGLVSKDYSENIGTELFEIDKESYEKSAFIPQGRVEADLSKAGDISAKLSDLLESENDIASFEGAINIIKDAKNKFKRTGGIIKKLENQLSAEEENIKKTEELILIQNELKNHIAEKRSTKKSIQDNIEKAHSYLQKKERINFYESLKKDIEKSHEILETLKSKVKKIPEENELSIIRVKTDELKNALAIYESKKLTLDEEQKLETLTKDIGEKILNKENAEEVRKLFSRYYTLKELMATVELTKTETEKLSLLSDLFENQIPEEEMNEIYFELRSLEDGRKNNRLIPYFAGILLLLAGGVSLFLAKTVLAIALFVLGALAFIIPLLNSKKSFKKAENIKNKAIAFFKKYDVYYEGDINSSFRELKEKKEEFETLLNKRKHYDMYEENKELSSLKDEIKNKAEYYFGNYESIQDAETKINDLIKKSEILQDLSSKSVQEKGIKKQVETFREALLVLTKEYTSKDPEEAYEFLSFLKAQKDREEEALEDKKAKLKDFVLKNGVLEAKDEDEISASQIDVLKESLEELDEEIIASEKRLMDIVMQTELLPELISEKENTEEELYYAKKKLSLTEKAEEALIKAKENLAIKYLGPLSQNFENYKKLLLAPDAAKLDTELNVGVIEGGEKHSSVNYSAGTRDILALALRFSLIKSLFENEKPVVIMDDPFVNLDEERMKEAKKALEILSSEHQILYFICHESRK